MPSQFEDKKAAKHKDPSDKSRLVTPEPEPEDQRLERTLRPHQIEDFTGQERIVEQLGAGTPRRPGGHSHEP